MDWISDGIARIRNAIMTKQSFVIVRGTKTFLQMLKIMKQEGFIKDYILQEDDSLKQACLVKLLYKDSKSVVRGLKRISKPSLRVYVSSSDLKPYLKKFAVTIVSTSKGILSGREALKQNLGGELICEVL